MTKAALAQLAASLPEGAFVVLEATGGYERPLTEALFAAGVTYARMNPRQVREFARATGRLAKTDKVDAEMLAQMGEALKPRPTRPLSRQRAILAELVARRDDLVGMRVAEKNRRHQASDPAVRLSIERLIEALTAEIDALEKAIDELVAGDSELRELKRRLCSVPGVGPVVAAVLIAKLPELGEVERRPIACLAGLAPHACDSGQMRGKRMTWGGRADVRRALYRAALSASQGENEFKHFRRSLQDRGKPTKVALIATARRLLECINAIVRDRRDYEPRPA
jgi:transposase